MKFGPSNPFVLPSLGVLPACLVGVGIMVLLDAPKMMPLMNLATAFVGLVGIGFGAASLARWIERRTFGIAAALALPGFATLFDAGLNGVFRWVRLGPLRLHLTSILTPALLWAWLVLWERQKTTSVLVLFVLLLGLLGLQPDAGQATALAAAMLVLALLPDKRTVARAVLVGLSVVGAAVAWTRPDPLVGVDMVEYIVPRAWAFHPALGAVAIGALAWLPMTTAMTAHASRKNQFTRTYGLMLTGYFAAGMLVSATGKFPTPVLGFGASPILGALLGLGLLRRSPES